MDTDQTTQPLIDSERVLEVLTSIVAEHPEGYTYRQRFAELGGTTPDDEFGEPPCRYQVNGQPGCIVGVAFDRLGIPLRPEWDRDAGLTAGRVIDSYLPFQFTREARFLLGQAQREQDMGATWAGAVESAREGSTL